MTSMIEILSLCHFVIFSWLAMTVLMVSRWLPHLQIPWLHSVLIASIELSVRQHSKHFGSIKYFNPYNPVR